ncbi:MAG: pirin family protein [Burkholderiaceae bacterium]|nr:pirin family protein [Burkholderiaceae bacterium]
MKKVLGVYSGPRPHWVGDGFPVRSMFSYQTHGKLLSPFLLLDYAGPAEFTPTTHRRGVGQHPHRGFETVTIVYKGEVSHKDSTGKGGTIGPGDVQWMTAGSGILHEEYHSDAFAKSGGLFTMVQLWVNLPAADKMATPGYQAIVDADIPVAQLPNDGGKVRVIAGDLAGKTGPAHTFSPMHVWDLHLNQGSINEFTVPEGWSTALIVLQGTVQVNGNAIARESQMVVLDQAGERLAVEANSDAIVLLISGQPIDEPIVGYGPFVMNTEQEIAQAMQDFNSGHFGSMAH